MKKLRADAVTWQEVDGEIVCLDLERSEYLAVNAAGALLWPHLVAGTETEVLVDCLEREFNISSDLAESDVQSFLSMLREYRLLEEI